VLKTTRPGGSRHRITCSATLLPFFAFHHATSVSTAFNAYTKITLL
jgi:hypothetical protein